MRAISLAIGLLCLSPLPVQADDRGALTAFLEDSLSGAGRTVVITGFAGALSSRATIEELTIADKQGVWITLRGVELDWSRSALLSGRVEVSQLSAEEIVLDRLPVAEESALPAPEAKGFSLPELPVSIQIGELSAPRIELGPTVLGQAVEGRLDAAMSLAAGEGRAELSLLRTDSGPDGAVTLTASYANSTGRLAIDLSAREGAGGLAASLLDVPGRPAADLAIKGAGPLEDFAADIRLATDGIDRLSGRVILNAAEDGAQGFAADLAGDLAPLFLPEYAAFFGSDVALSAQGARAAEGRVRLDSLSVRTRALTVDGTLSLATDGLPEAFDLQARLATPEGMPVLLPLSGVETRVQSAAVNLSYDSAVGDGWRGEAVLTGLDRADFRAESLSLSGSGRIGRGPAGNVFGATIAFAGAGLAPSDPAVARALGPRAEGKARLFWQTGSGRLDLPQIRIVGDGFSLSGRLGIEGLATGLRMTGRAEAEATDLARYSGLAGRELGGRGTVVIEGSGSRLSGEFDLTGYATGEGLQIGQPEVDRLLSGPSRIDASLRRDSTGTVLRSLTVAAQSLTATANGTLATAGSSLVADIAFSDLGALGSGYRGALTAKATFDGTPERGAITLAGTGRNLAVGQSEVDRLLSGEAEVSARLALNDGQVEIETARIATPQLQLEAAGRIAGALREITLKGRLANLALLLPEFPGAATLSGTAVQDDSGYRLDLRGLGPGQIDARVAGRIASGFGSADLKITGTGQAALANAFIDPRAVSGRLGFDLGMKGPLRLSSLSGRVTLSGGRVTDVNAGLAFERTEAVATLARGVAQIAATSQLTTGGRLRVGGTIGLAAPYRADLALQLDSLMLRDPILYETTASGGLSLIGPLRAGALLSGRITLGQTELQIPATGLGGAGALPGLTHRNEPVAVRATRGRAGLLAAALTDAGRGGGSLRLDLVIDAPSRVFVRGRGLDAELGGQLRLGGTTSSIIASGGFQLIRGRLDLLGKRLTLSRAILDLEGDFVPFVDVMASSTNDGITAIVTIEGPATNPVVSFSSSPELPQEEVLAQLLFGRDLQTITPLQAARLANAVRTLSGRGGEGLVGKLRRSFGLDDFDLATSADGTTTLRAGKYLSENVYTDIEVDQDGRSQINLNLDLRKGLTVTGRVSDDGETGLGVFLEQDY